VWIENIEGDELLAYRNPVDAICRTTLTLHRGNVVSATAFPDVRFDVARILC
jgi:hypothetical protein